MFSRSLPGRLARRGASSVFGFVLRRVIFTRTTTLIILAFIGLRLWLALIFGPRTSETIFGDRITVLLVHLAWSVALISFAGGLTIFNRVQALPIARRIFFRIRRVPFLWQASLALIVVSLLLSLLADMTAFEPLRFLSAPILALTCLDALALISALQVARERRTQIKWRPTLLTLLSTTEQVLAREHTWITDSRPSAVARLIARLHRTSIAEQRTLTITDPPRAALTSFSIDPTSSKWRTHVVAILGDGWVGDVDNDSSGPAALVLREATDREADDNRALIGTEGAVLSVEPIYADPEESGNPDADIRGHQLNLAPKVTPSQLDRINAWAEDAGYGEIVEYEPDRRRAVVRKLESKTREFRALTAEIMGVAAWSLDMEVRIQETGEVEVVVSRFSRRSDTSLADRLQAWRGRANELVPASVEWLWKVEWDAGSRQIRMNRYKDPLLKSFSIEEFEKRIPDRQAYTSYPVAVCEDGTLHYAPMFHVLGVGATGSGKGSMVWATLRPFLELGLAELAELYAIDPKGAEAVRDDGIARGCFKWVATTPEAWTALLDKIIAEMERRKERGGRTHAVSKDEPVLILFIDELSAVSVLDREPRRSKANNDKLLEIATQGRSLNIFIAPAAVQQPLKEMIGPLREAVDIRYALRTKKPSYTDMILGQDATALGAVAHELEPATPANNYRTAGIAWAMPESSAVPVRIRFPYISPKWLDAWDERYFEKYPERRTRRPSRDANTETRLDAFKDEQERDPNAKPRLETPSNLDPDAVARFRVLNDD